ncbi:hypothetical protein PBI_HYPERION_59 [Microbacterium phage Hyperion]|uniref:Uncharacterized protein n=1 Tax=Microbacterium phage Hyperion TaxID=2182354 RepID=A0A2U8UIR1_9CAUD|nr:hypothetical protein HOT27_gp059 [Microbacterium phage Hyperion]AWN03574.1 hypothetical protein PBI_HYPERION_59 [Microbacterium phage Hyperion]
MRVSIAIESDGVVTEVNRYYEPEATEVRNGSGDLVAVHEEPPLATVTQAVAAAAVTAHRPTTKEHDMKTTLEINGLPYALNAEAL